MGNNSPGAGAVLFWSHLIFDKLKDERQIQSVRKFSEDPSNLEVMTSKERSGGRGRDATSKLRDCPFPVQAECSSPQAPTETGEESWMDVRTLGVQGVWPVGEHLPHPKAHTQNFFLKKMHLQPETVNNTKQGGAHLGSGCTGTLTGELGGELRG